MRIYQFRDRTRICYHDLSVTQCYALSAILGRGPMTLKALAASLYLEKSTVSRLVDSLEQKGYVRRLEDPSDGRALQLEVTSKGQKLHSRIEDDLVDEMTRFLVDFDPDVRRATTQLIVEFTKEAAARFASYKKPHPAD
ncbi:MAG: MarR family transcriptional regulator [Candidatus Krumholzibacteria bacterium]|nr:MarR family transcriptional regulator [Candidatus Krumholzibacteria bacterium]